MSEQQEHPPQTAELEAEVARLDDRFKRARADLDNLRKRTARDVDRLVTERTDALIGDWLEVADSVGRALTTDGDGAIGDGLRAVRDQIASTLARQGVERLCPKAPLVRLVERPAPLQFRKLLDFCD